MIRKDKAISTAVIAIIIVVALVAAVAIVYGLMGYFANAIKPSEVSLSGTVTTTGTGTSPEKITFTSESNGNTYVANANGGSYSISLPNRDTYKVNITWNFLGITGGTADAGTLNLDSMTVAMTKNWSG